MNYIILDLEWDSAYCKKHGRFVNQILQIGAVKLDSKFCEIGKFSKIVRSSFAKKVSKRFATLTGITSEDMLAGIPFVEAVNQYNEWAGNDFITLTWSNSDLFAIMENTRLFLDEGNAFKLGKYVDLQKYFQSEMKLCGEEIVNQVSLSNAAEMLKISTEAFDLHTAIDDSKITAEILKRTYNAERFAPFIKDTANPEFYRKLMFKNYYLSRLDSKEIKPQHLEFLCDKCGSVAVAKKKFKYRNHWFMNEFKCSNCDNKFLGRVMFKMTYNGLKVTKRIIHPAVKEQKDELSV